MNTVYGPALTYLRVTLEAHYAKARSEDTERGASAIEWVIISAIVVAIVVFVGIILTNVLKSKATDVCKSINDQGGNGSSTCTTG